MWFPQGILAESEVPIAAVDCVDPTHAWVIDDYGDAVVTRGGGSMWSLNRLPNRGDESREGRVELWSAPPRLALSPGGMIAVSQAQAAARLPTQCRQDARSRPNTPEHRRARSSCRTLDRAAHSHTEGYQQSRLRDVS